MAGDRLTEAESLFRQALSLLDNFGPEHVRLPRLLQQLGKNLEALDHFKRITPYSHRYAAEFVEPEYQADELLPRLANGMIADPSTPVRIDGHNGNIAYWAHLYFEVAQTQPIADVVRLAKAISNRSFFAVFGLGRRIRCATSPPKLAGTGG